jgi:hypothetical protein
MSVDATADSCENYTCRCFRILLEKISLMEGESRSLAAEIWLPNSRNIAENFISVTY